MPLLEIDERLTSKLVNALGNTLVHSLWQGVLLAAVAGLIIICTKRLTAALRYNLLAGALMLFVAGVAVTFVMQFAGTPNVSVTQTALEQEQIVATITTYQPVVSATPTSFTSELTGYLNSHYNTIVLIWFLIICAKSIQLAVGLYGTNRLKHIKITTVNNEWQVHIQQLAGALGIRQTVTLLQSGLAKVPLVIGHLKPVILLPLGLLTTLTPAETEAILVHELAHIRRRDYLVNMLQSLVEIVFFFNPAVLWISQLIKTERENCCDDLALQYGDNKANYIRALVSCEEYRPLVPAHAMAFPGGRHSLLNRVKRIAANRNHSLNVFEKTALAVCLVVSGLCMSAFTIKQHAKSTAKEVAPTAQHAAEGDSLQQAVNTTTPNTLLQPAKNQQGLLAAGADSTFYPPDYDSGPEGSATDMEWKRKDHAANLHINTDMLKEGLITDAQHFSFQLGGKAFIINGRQQGNEIFKRYQDKYVPAAKHGTDWTWSHTVNYPANNALAVQAGEKIKGDTLPGTVKQHDSASVSMQGGYPSPKAYNAIPKAYNPPPKAYEDNAGAYARNKASSYYAGRYSAGETQQVRDSQNAVLAEIITDMLQDKIITEKDNLDFTITATEFIINGIKQDEAIFQRYKKKYVPANNRNNWSWGHSQHDPRRS